MNKTNKNGFTLIELLVVIAILGVLMGLLGPKVFDLLSGSKATKTQAIFKSWVTQIYQYKSEYNHYPEFLLADVEEGQPLLLSADENHDKFIAALKGMSWEVSSQTWVSLTDELLDQNPRSKQFHSFSEDEFGDEGYLADAWGGRDIRILVDQDGDGLIELSSQALDEIKTALQSQFEIEEIEQASEKFKVIRDKVAIYVIEDPSGETDSENVFSWDIKKYFVD